MSLPANVRAWRKAQRAALLNARAALADQRRIAIAEAIQGHVRSFEEALRGLLVGCYAPIREEPDLTPWMRDWVAAGNAAALPALVEQRAPLRFRRWFPGVAMEVGIMGIAVPAGSEVVAPDALLVPMVGFDERGFRLGYGGEYWQRMLGEMTPRPITIGVADDAARVANIFPQPDDATMDLIVTESGVYAMAAVALRLLSAADIRARLRSLAAALDLPRPASEAASKAAPVELSSPVCYASQFPGYFGEEPGSTESSAAEHKIRDVDNGAH